MNLLGIETATENCSVALLSNNNFYQKSHIAPQQHAELTLGFVEITLKQANIQKSNLDGIVFGQGPGAFTGVRIALSITQGLALGLNIPVLGFSTLKILACGLIHNQHIPSGSRILVVNDARMGEVYHTAYQYHQPNQLTNLYPEKVSRPEDIDTENYDYRLGNAFNTYPALAQSHKQTIHFLSLLPQAQDMLKASQENFLHMAYSIDRAQPVYIRDQVVRS